MLDDLQRLGFNRNQANVYYGLLRLGKCTVRQLSAATGLNRVTVHGIVEQLESMGVCYALKKGRTRQVVPLDPMSLRFLLRNQAADLSKKERVFSQLAPALEQLYRNPSGKSDVVILAGDNTYDYLIADALSQAHETPQLLLLNTDLLTPEGIALMRTALYPHQVAKKIPTRLIIPDTACGHAFAAEHFFADPERSPPVVLRFLGQQDFHFATHLVIYADTVALVSLRDTSAILLKDEEVKNSMLEFFRFIWERAGSERTNR